MSPTRYPLALLIDDNELDTFINKKLLETEGFANEIIVQQSAQGGLEYLRKNASTPEKIPAIIFLDIMMPGMDGFGFLDEYDKLDDSVKSKCKIVMLSTSESFKDLNRANQNKYVSKFLNKPLTGQMVSGLSQL